MTEIEKVSVEFEARVAEAIAKIEELKAAIRSIGNDRNSIVRITDGGSARRTADNTRRDMRRAGDDTERSWRDVFRRIMADNDSALGRMVRASRRDGERAGRNFGDGFRRESRRGLGLAPGGQRADWGKLIGMTLPAIAPAAAGLAAPLAGAFEVAMPALFSTAAIAPFVVSAFGQVQKAAQALGTQQDKFNAAAGRTAIALKTDKDAAFAYQGVLVDMNPAERDLANQLSKSGTSWESLTARQKLGAIQLRENTDLYKKLSPAQKEALNALIAERAAWVNLDPQQTKALRNYQKMSDTFSALKTKLEPTMFRVLADAEQAAIDGMRPLYPVLHQVALGFDDLFRGLDRWFKSDDYQRFVAMWAGDARRNIDSVGGAIGRIVLGLIHMYEAMHPLMKPSEDWLDHITKKFADWPTSPKGQVEFQHFMADVTTQGPLVWGTLKNIGKGFDLVIAALAGNPLPWQVLKDISKVMLWIASAPGGRVAINIIAWSIAIDRLAKSLKSLALVQGILGLVSRGGAGVAAGGAAAGAAAGATRVLSPAAIRAAAGGAGGAAAGGTLWGAVSNPVGATVALAAGATIAGIAIYKWAKHVQQKSDEAAGIVRHSDGSISAATSVHGQKVSKAFRDLADQYRLSGTDIAKGAEENKTKVRYGGQVVVGEYGKMLDDSNKKIKDVMYLGRTQFGQVAGLFAQSFGQDVAKMGEGLKKGGKTLNQRFEESLSATFQGLGARTSQQWKFWQGVMAKNMDDFFAKQRATTRTDYLGLQSAMQRYESDFAHGRTSKLKADIQALERATIQFEDDSNKGLISNANKNMKRLSSDLAKFMSDLATGNSKAWKGDIARLEKDTKGNFSSMADHIGAAASRKFDEEIAKAQSDIARISSQISSQILGPFGGGTTKKKARGGILDGPGTGTSDSIPIMASKGEFVVNAASTARHRELLEAINGKGYANGGLVGAAGEGTTSHHMLWKGWDVAVGRLVKQRNDRILAQAASIAAIAAAAAAAGPVGGGAVFNAVAAGAAQQYAKSILGRYGWGSNQFGPLKSLWNGESGWNYRALNASSGAYGIPQALPAGKMASAGADWRTNYQTQIRWGLGYIRSVYGSPGNAYSRWLSRHPHWYDEGGVLPPGVSAVVNRTRKPEAVLNDAQWRAISRLAARGAGGVTVPIVITLDGRKIYESVRTRGWQAQARNGRDMWSLT
ncbi:aggregation-promoting factor C-terminal-like domain-containing protein [Streptomyces mirabilis]|uniref:aggregation-promoting factor C-terminal-like domain-containing protein n=1 Tax=Streptomyces mirabilis TaxID=68239 RepID=UPI0036B26AF4